MKNLNHLAIIPDGNRRWACDHSIPTVEGHRRGFEAIKKLSAHVRKKRIHTLTIWAFSTENWNRDKSEIDYLMKIYETWIKANLKTAMKDDVRIFHLGRKDRIPASLVQVIQTAEDKTKQNKTFELGIALDYGGRDEILRAIRNEKDISRFLDTKEFKNPNPDLVIRTSGEFRTSGFMIWQAAYSEWIFYDKFLPDFTTKDLDICLEEYQLRQRRYGK